MRLLHLIIVIFPFFTIVHAQTGHSWVGFKDEADSAIPHVISKAADSVFLITVPHGEPIIKDVTNVDIRTMLKKGDKPFYILQVIVCQNQRITKCPIFPKTNTGTAFLLKNQQTVATNLHNIQGWLYYIKKFNPGLSADDLQAPILLADKEQNILFTPLNGQSTLKLKFYNKSPAIFSSIFPFSGGDKLMFFRASDYVELYTNIPINKTPLKIGNVHSNLGQLYAIGFPQATNLFKRFGGIDSSGDRRLVSTGALKEGYSIESLNVLTDISSAKGSSGSPILNSQGEVIGILFAGTNEELDGKLHTRSQFLQFNFSLMQEAWDQFDSNGRIRPGLKF